MRGRRIRRHRARARPRSLKTCEALRKLFTTDADYEPHSLRPGRIACESGKGSTECLLSRHTAAAAVRLLTIFMLGSASHPLPSPPSPTKILCAAPVHAPRVLPPHAYTHPPAAAAANP